MFLILPMKILRQKKLSWEQKIVLGEIWTLHRNRMPFFATPEWAEANLGIANLDQVLSELEEKGYIYLASDGWKMTDMIIQKLTEL